MRLRTLNTLGLLTMLLGLTQTAQAQSLTVFDAPNAFETYSHSINARGDVTGFFHDTSQADKERSFVRDRAGNMTVFDAPNASYTESLSINAGGAVTGFFYDASQSNKQRGFVRDRNGDLTVFDAPNASYTVGL